MLNLSAMVMRLPFSHRSPAGKMSQTQIKIQTEDFDTGAAIEILRQQTSNIGAIVSFTGLVREFSEENSITSMTLEHYPGMTESVLENIAADATQRWDLYGTHITHRVGELKAGDNIVLVVTAAAHRKAAFEAAQYIMDFLKTQAPFWKKENTRDGSYWVEGKASDNIAKNRW